METHAVWCPSCGAEYRAGSSRCSDCRVALVPDPPGGRGTGPSEIDASGDQSALGEWPRLSAQILRRRLESAGIPVMIEWAGAGAEATGIIVVPARHAEFASAVLNEIEVDDEVPDTSPIAYVSRIEEHLAAAAGLLDELRTSIEDLEA